MLGMDANAHFSDDQLPYVGTCGLEQKGNVGAEHFCQLMISFDLYLPATYVDQHEGDTTTWINWQCSWGTCDYVAIPLSWRTNVVSSYVAPTLDAGTMTADHCAAVVWMKLQYIRSRIAKPQYDTRSIATLPKEEFQRVADKLSISWECDVHTHAKLVSETLAEWLNETCPKTKNSPRKTYIQQSTWKLGGTWAR